MRKFMKKRLFRVKNLRNNEQVIVEARNMGDAKELAGFLMAEVTVVDVSLEQEIRKAKNVPN